MTVSTSSAQPALWRARLRAAWQWMHHGSSLLGLCGLAAAAYLYCAPQTALHYGQEVGQWLEARAAGAAVQSGVAVADAQPAAAQLSPSQQSVADWLARRYSIAPLAMQQLVSRAWEVGQQQHLEPSLILAVMAVESSFNPFAQSSVGATGLMQVMTQVHSDKFAQYGGSNASIDPAANLQVGALVLKDAIARAGSLRGGLQMYAGASNDSGADSYASKVLAEQARLRAIAHGAKVSVKVPLRPAPKPLNARAQAAERTAGDTLAADPAA